MLRFMLCWVILAVLVCNSAEAALTVPSDGSDSTFNPSQNTQIDLSQAITGVWDQTSPQPGKGVYDPEKWAVVFKYKSVNIPAGVTVTFKNHPSYAPVVWLVQNDVTIGGTLSLNGQNGLNVTSGPPFAAEPGPGGFHSGSVKLAPGGGSYDGGCARGPGSRSYGDSAVYSFRPALSNYRPYGNEGIVPLIGGSGGGSDANKYTGGGGGGAVLIASAGTIEVSGTISAGAGSGGYGYAGSGSGGAIRLVGEIVRGAGSLWANLYGQAGRIRIEANDYSFSLNCSVGPSVAPAGTTARIWPDENHPKIKAVSVGNQSVPVDPRPTFALGKVDLMFTSTGSRTVTIQAENVPTNWYVRVRAVKGSGHAITGFASFVSGNLESSTWQYELNMDTEGFYFIQVDAFRDPMT